MFNQLAGAIRAADPDRLIIFEPTACNGYDDIVVQSTAIKAAMDAQWDNILYSFNFCECAYVYAEMTAVSGEHIDHNNHSMFKPEYPTVIYAAQYHISNGAPLTLTGTLPAGTTIDIYLSQTMGAGRFSIIADGQEIYGQQLYSQTYTTESPLSGYYPYAQSNKHISVTLPSNAQTVTVSYGGSWFEWSGIDITLPQTYAVQRWWFPSAYDAALSLTDVTEPTLKSTSVVQLSPNSYDSGRIITISQDVSYSSNAVVGQATAETVQTWADTIDAFVPRSLVRFENAGFSIGTTQTSAAQYYGDLLSALSGYEFGWYSNDFGNILSANSQRFAGAQTVEYKAYSNFNAELLQLFQQYQTENPERAGRFTVGKPSYPGNVAAGSQITSTISVTGGAGSYAYNWYLFRYMADGGYAVIQMSNVGVFDNSWTFDLPDLEGIYCIRVIATDGINVDFADCDWFYVYPAPFTVGKPTSPGNVPEGTDFTTGTQVTGGNSAYGCAYNYYLFHSTGTIAQQLIGVFDNSWELTLDIQPSDAQQGLGSIYLIRVIATDGTNVAYADTDWFYVYPDEGGVLGSPPTILTQPTDQTVVVGNSAIFFVEATGYEPLTYQWYVNTNTGIGWTEIADANSNTYTTVVATLAADGFRYYCKITDAVNTSADSDIAVLTVITQPQTGDDSHPAWLIVLGALAAVGVAVLLLLIRRWERK